MHCRREAVFQLESCLELTSHCTSVVLISNPNSQHRMVKDINERGAFEHVLYLLEAVAESL